MKLYILGLTSFLLLAGCNPELNPSLIVEKPVVFVPDKKLFNCPSVNQFPDPDTLTDVEVAELLVTMNTYNKICKRSLTVVYQQLINAKKELEQEK